MRDSYEKTPLSDHVSPGMADDRSTRASSGDSRPGRARRHPTANASPDSAGRYARAESIQFLTLPGMVCRNRKEERSDWETIPSLDWKISASWSERISRTWSILAPLTALPSSAVCGSWLVIRIGCRGHEHFEPGEVPLRPHEGSTPIATLQFLVAVLAGLQVPFVCSETHELGEELVGSYLYQIHLYHWLESNDYGRFLADNDI